MLENFRAFLKFVQFLVLCALAVPFQMLLLCFFKDKGALVLPHFFHRIICHIFGLRVETCGAPCREGRVLYVGNHVSYFDIMAISAVLPVSFVAKAEVAAWPFFGFLAKLQRTVFIDRARHAVRKGSHAIKNGMARGKSLVLFPEGTSSDGRAVLPFKSSLFGIAFEEKEKILIQPFTIELAEVEGRKVFSQQDRDMYAWYGDMTLIPHFWSFAKSRGAKVRLHFHTPIQVKEGDDRKMLARICQETVARALGEEK